MRSEVEEDKSEKAVKPEYDTLKLKGSEVPDSGQENVSNWNASGGDEGASPELCIFKGIGNKNSGRNEPFEDSSDENDAISYYLDITERILKAERILNPHTVTDIELKYLRIRKSLAKSWVHARLSNCLAKARDSIFASVAPAFLAYEWGKRIS